MHQQTEYKSHSQKLQKKSQEFQQVKNAFHRLPTLTNDQKTQNYTTQLNALSDTDCLIVFGHTDRQALINDFIKNLENEF